MGYNDFLKSGLYGPTPDEDRNGQPDYAARRAHWNQNNPEISDERVLRDRAQRAQVSGPAGLGQSQGARVAKLQGRLKALEQKMWKGGNTVQQQANNIKRRNALKEKLAAAQNREQVQTSSSHIGFGITRTDAMHAPTSPNKAMLDKINARIAANRRRVKNYLDIMGDDKARPLGLSPDAVRKTAWGLAGQEARTGVPVSDNIGRGIHISNLPPTAPQEKPGFVRHAVGLTGINNFVDVLHAQKTLAAKGYLGDESVTGYIGTATVNAIKAMRKAEGRPVTGTLQPGDAAPGENPDAESDLLGSLRTVADAVLLGDGDVIAGLTGWAYGGGRQILNGNFDQAWDTASGMYDAMAFDHRMRLQEFAANNPKTAMALRATGAVPATAGGAKAGVQLTHGAARAAAPTVGRSITGTRNLLDDGVSRTIEFSGREYWIGDKLRVAPFGNRTGHRIGEWPHYHRSVPDPRSPMDSLPGQGIGRHRPWETKRPDKSWKDRF